jgi:putative membrane protein
MRGLAASTIMVFCILAFSGYAYCYDNNCWEPVMQHGRMFTGILWILFLVLALILVYGLVKGKKVGLSDSPTADSPLDILKRRYAKGEITKEEFDRIKGDIV